MPKMMVNDLNVYYEDHGAGEPLVFIHGLGSSTKDWEHQVDHFSTRYRVILVDVRGHGQTGKPAGPYSVQMFAQDLAGLIGALGIPAAHLCGISMGGMIAFQMAVDYPEMVKTLTVVNSGANLVSDSFKERWNIFQRLAIFRLLSMEKIGETLAKRIFIKPEQEALRTVFVERWSENFKPAYMAATRGLVGWTVEDMLGEIACPALLVAADEDYSPLEDKQRIASKMKNAELVVIEDSRHATPVEHPGLFNQTLDAFLSRNTN
ncbi:MAG: alpha/beta hydrolase [Chloroflexota bacterium]